MSTVPSYSPEELAEYFNTRISEGAAPFQVKEELSKDFLGSVPSVQEWAEIIRAAKILRGK